MTPKALATIGRPKRSRRQEIPSRQSDAGGKDRHAGQSKKLEIFGDYGISGCMCGRRTSAEARRFGSIVPGWFRRMRVGPEGHAELRHPSPVTRSGEYVSAFLHLAAFLEALLFGHRPPALALAGVLSTASIFGGRTFALAFTRIDTCALHLRFLGIGR